MTIPTRNVLLSLLFATALAACGSDGDDVAADPGANPGTNPPPAGDVTLDQLNGTWLGTFDDRNSVRTMELTADGGNITGISLEGTPTNLSGPITKVSGTARTFRFELRNQETPPQTISSGMLLVDGGGSHLFYVDQFFNVGVIQKDATAVPTYAAADLNRSWSGTVFTTTSGFGNFTQAGTSATCTAATPTTSACDVTVTGGPAREATQLTMDDPRGRWLGNYTDTPTTGSPENGTTRAYLSPDKTFAGVWNCTDFAGGFPETCDFSTWKR